MLRQKVFFKFCRHLENNFKYFLYKAEYLPVGRIQPSFGENKRGVIITKG